ncbi:MAG: YbgF trimerization domain-containing protein [Porticoccaceae bacterium]|nr:YbgF trimerization domain-containing protein [Porticoccaceae bacterium]
MKLNIALVVLLSSFSASAIGQNPTQVIDLSSPITANQPPENNVISTADVRVAGDSYYQSQVLQEEVQMLRGMVEELTYELQQVKQRQMDDYLDLDRRLGAVIAGAPVAQPAAAQMATPDAGQDTFDASNGSGQSAEPVTVAPADTAAMKTNYDNASDLLLKERDIEGAALAFKQHVIDFPTSPYVANAYYWLGEIYLLQGQDELARQAFTAVVEQHATHGKAMDASFKLGKIYHQLGDDSRARELLEIAAQSTGGAAKKAQSYLNNNF